VEKMKYVLKRPLSKHESMKIIEASYRIETPIDGAEILKRIEQAGRTCYKSEDRITAESAEAFVRKLILRGHESVLEHESVTVRFVCDRGISHEIVRHRIASFSQESTRYCNYSNDRFGSELTFIKPCFLEEGTVAYKQWILAVSFAGKEYFALLDCGCTPQEARSVLPNSLKTEVVMTTNLREWRHFLKLRTAKTAHPQMRELTVPLLYELQRRIPVVFDDIKEDNI
jgi:thymidylate synthase (FAD)